MRATAAVFDETAVGSGSRQGGGGGGGGNDAAW